MRAPIRQWNGIVPASCVSVLLALVVGTASASSGSDGAIEPGPESEPVDAIFVLDNSGSMRRNDPDRATWRLVTDFAVAMPRTGRLGVVLFDDNARLVEPLTRAVGQGSASHWMGVMQRLDYSGQLTNSPAGIERALYELKHAGRDGARRVIVFVTDGIVDTGDSRRDIEKTRWLKNDLATEAARAGVRIFGIAFTEAADVELIQALALATGGEYWRVQQAADIAGVLSDVGRRMVEVPTAPRRVAAGPDPDVSMPDLSMPGLTMEGLRDRLLPPVDSAPPDRTRGLVLLTLGLALGAMVLAYPLVDRRRRRVRVRPSAFSDSPADRRGALPLPALPRAGRPPVVKLIDVSDAMGSGQAVLLLEKPTTRIGRDAESDVPIPSDTVSSFHATIDYRDGYFYVEDHRSTNGTSLNGQRLTANEPVRLKSGDRIDVANHELRFVIPDHEPRGRTAILSITSMPPMPDHQATEVAGPPSPGAAGGEPPPRGEHADERPTPPAERAASQSGVVESAAEEHGGVDTPDEAVVAFDQCLGAHLEKVASLGAAHRQFVDAAFAPEVRDLLVRRVQDLVERCRRADQGEQVDLSRSGVHYTLCVVPETMARARNWYAERHGGYAKFLVGLLDAWASSERQCDAVCVITFGIVRTPWLSVTVMPARDDTEAIEVMSYEFLTDDERRNALELDIVDVPKDA